MQTSFLLLVLITVAAAVAGGGYAIESPKYTVIHSESDFEIRLYAESSWMSALVRGTSFQESTKDGFHRLYQCIHGANVNNTEFPMTSPVLTSISQSSSESVYVVRYFLSSEHENSPPEPYPELDLELDKWKSQCMAVRKFSGFAKDDNIEEEKDSLVSSLKKHSTEEITADENAYSIAQYNASFHLTDRLNEVWIDVLGFTAEGCPA
ncbi:hypothetical protein SLE2022_203350 [Rubroshorea leprosula]